MAGHGYKGGLEAYRLEQRDVEDRQVVAVARFILQRLPRELKIIDGARVAGKVHVGRGGIDHVLQSVKAERLVHPHGDPQVEVAARARAFPDRARDAFRQLKERGIARSDEGGRAPIVRPGHRISIEHPQRLRAHGLVRAICHRVTDFEFGRYFRAFRNAQELVGQQSHDRYFYGLALAERRDLREDLGRVHELLDEYARLNVADGAAFAVHYYDRSRGIGVVPLEENGEYRFEPRI